MSITSTPRKTGRPQKHFVDRNGNTIVGLSRRPSDGRWRIIETGHTFTEADETLAIAHFREWEAGKVESNLGKLRVHANAEAAMLDLARRTIDAGGSLDAALERGADGSWAVMDDHLSSAQWAWLRKQIIDRPKWVAERVGIEKIGYLRDVQEPERVPSFDELGRIWGQHFNSSAEQRRKCPIAFKDFRDVTGVAGIEDIKPDVVVKYRDAVYARKLTGKGQSNLFTRIRRYLSFFRDRAIAIDTINRGLGYLALLTPNQTTVTLDPKPIEVADFKKLLAKAEGDDRAMVLLMLNAAMYVAEVVRLRWDDIRDGCLITHRSKTGKCVRVATLWPETLAELAKVKRRGPSIFVNYAGAQLANKGAEKRFRDLRDAAKLPHVTSSMLRDGAYTSAVEANVSSNLCQLLVGHRSGLQDNYVKRKPRMVAPACDAIRGAYFVGNNVAA